MWVGVDRDGPHPRLNEVLVALLRSLVGCRSGEAAKMVGLLERWVVAAGGWPFRDTPSAD